MSLNGVYPYVGYDIGDRFLLWGVVGTVGEIWNLQ